MTQPAGRKPPGPLLKTFGRVTTRAAAHAPWTWRLMRGPVRRVFESLAGGWDERTRADSEERLAPLTAALEHVQGEPARVLDIGTGTGTGAFFLSSRYPGAAVVGIDLAEAMIENARAKAPERGPSVRFEVADIDSYRPGQPFDLVLMLNMPAFFERVAALVAPGGYVVTIASRGPTTPFYTPSSTLERGFAKRGLRTVAAAASGPATYHVAQRPPA